MAWVAMSWSLESSLIALSFTPVIQSINKFYWLCLQNIPRIQLLCHQPTVTSTFQMNYTNSLMNGFSFCSLPVPLQSIFITVPRVILSKHKFHSSLQTLQWFSRYSHDRSLNSYPCLPCSSWPDFCSAFLTLYLLLTLFFILLLQPHWSLCCYLNMSVKPLIQGLCLGCPLYLGCSSLTNPHDQLPYHHLAFTQLSPSIHFFFPVELSTIYTLLTYFFFFLSVTPIKCLFCSSAPKTLPST